MTKKQTIDQSSYKDPDGFVFYQNKQVYRQVNNSYKALFTHIQKSGLYKTLTQNGLLIKHKTTSIKPITSDGYLVIKPKTIPFISYPYEWCFDQLKDAAIATLNIQKTCIKYDVSLKDASAYNIQFLANQPTLIDTLSFEQKNLKTPWVAYKQFCEHFLAPLVLASYVDIRLFQLLRTNIDGIPLDLASKLLPKYTWTKPRILTHVHFHAISQKKITKQRKIFNNNSLLNIHSHLALLDSLEATIKSLSWKKPATTWGNYDKSTSYNRSSLSDKKYIIEQFLSLSKPNTLWDLGANDGTLSQLSSNHNIYTIAFDIDPVAVTNNYQATKKQNDKYMLPLIIDLTNPSPDLGWQNNERSSFAKRGPVDAIMVLALIHHLGIKNNIPFDLMASFFSTITTHLLIEFIPKNDKMCQILLQNRKDIFLLYNKKEFESQFNKYFTIIKKHAIKNSKRIIYIMKNKKRKN